MKNEINKRVLFLDILRLFAIVMMVQGHTIDVLLKYDMKLPHSVDFGTYVFIRGLTAPLFLFCSGFIYGLQFRKITDDITFLKKFKSTIKRGLFLILVGYIAKSPTSSPFYLSHINDNLLTLFFAVDILHLIGFSLILFSAIMYFERKIKIDSKYILSIAIVFFILMYSVSLVIKWNSFLPDFLVSWLSSQYGSLFPIFPWVAYLLFGALIGIYSFDKNFQNNEIKLSERLIFLGLIFIIISLVNNYVEEIIFGFTTFWTGSPNVIFLRMGMVLIISSTISLISHSITYVPKYLLEFSKNSLAIYLVHLAILYGSAWNVGLKDYFGNELNLIESIIGVIIILLLMFLFSLLWTMVKKRTKLIYQKSVKKILEHQR